MSALQEFTSAHPARLLALLFAAVCLAGAGLLSLPIAVHHRIGFTDALFTATSATCVTGLMTLDPARDFTLFGQAVILILMQIGGLGVMTFSTFFMMALGGAVSLREFDIMSDSFGHGKSLPPRRLLKRVMALTFAMEAAGALVLFAEWAPGMGYGKAAFYSLFHSVSAFCNAGISLFPGGLAPFASNAVVNMTVMALIAMGSLGFLTIVELYSIALRPAGAHRWRMSLNCKLILSVTAILTLAPTLFFFLMERDGAFGSMTAPQAGMAALFHTVTRTAGFTTVDIAQFSDPSIFMYLLLMMIGAAPGSVGGGIKVTTFGVLIAMAAARYDGRERVSVFGRTISEDAVSRSFFVAFISALIVTLFVMMLLITESSAGAPFLAVLFEAVSAFGTVGLSLGLTSALSAQGKILLTLLMFIGRLGPLTAAMAAGGKRSRGEYHYAEERVMVG